MRGRGAVLLVGGSDDGVVHKVDVRFLLPTVIPFNELCTVPVSS
jgi:hypothetical protein